MKLNGVAEEARSFVSVLKWVLTSNGNISPVSLPSGKTKIKNVLTSQLLVTSEDVDNLIKSHIPIQVKKKDSKIAVIAVPIILGLEEPIGLILTKY